MEILQAIGVVVAVWGSLTAFAAQTGRSEDALVFGVYVEDRGSLENVLLLAESLRSFGGRYKGAPVKLYVPPDLTDLEPVTAGRIKALGVEVIVSRMPEKAKWFFYAGKVFAAARAEAEVSDSGETLVWLDPDTIILGEPRELVLPETKALAYRPVMHKNVGLLYSEPLDEFWGRAFQLLSVPEESFFTMTTPADGDTIRPYFNAGCLAVRPERGLMSDWADCFTTLYEDSLMAGMCEADAAKRIFLHQVALTGAILRHTGRDEMTELSAAFNYPIFFEEMFGAKNTFDDITGVVTLRYEYYFKDPDPDWDRRLKGPRDRIAWIKERVARRNSR
jgi:hypothetical protein